jgi:uncharacterized protein
MSINLNYPGVYIREVDPGVRTISGVATSITAFIGRAPRGLVDEPVTVRSFADYERRFGGLSLDSMMGYSVRHFFLNGGSEALIIRVHNPSAEGATDIATASLAVPGEGEEESEEEDEEVGNPLILMASSPGRWGNNLRAIVDHDTRDSSDTTLFNLRIEELNPNDENDVLQFEELRNLSVAEDSSRNVVDVLENQSSLVRVSTSAPLPETRPDPTDDAVAFANGNDGQDIGDDQIAGDGLASAKRGIWALEDADIFNLLCIPPYTRDEEVGASTWEQAAVYCERRRAMLIVDPPDAWNDASSVTDAAILAHVQSRSANAAVYFPRIRSADPLRENRLHTFAPSGAVAGIIARTDANRGIWKSPAGQDATLAGVSELAVKMTDEEQGPLNQRGVNCLRTFRVAGRVVWGARTLRGADALADQWKYIAVRRLALYIQESLYRGTQWVVFEPNDAPLWSQIRLSLGTFMHDLFRQGAFQGSTPTDAYFVKCDGETTTQSDIDRGIVNIIVGFAPLKPAEFVVIRIQQIAQQSEI